jgi:hypothetical protein
MGASDHKDQQATQGGSVQGGGQGDVLFGELGVDKRYLPKKPIIYKIFKHRATVLSSWAPDDAAVGHAMPDRLHYRLETPIVEIFEEIKKNLENGKRWV